MTRVLVTGGTGFVGAWVTRALVLRGYQVRVLDLHPQPATLDFVQPGLAAQVEIISGDIRDIDALEASLVDVNYVIHLAALMTVDCAANPAKAIEINLTCSQTLFELAARSGVQRIVYASTGAVYGPDSEIHPKPMSLYGILKLALEGVARVASQEHGLSSIGFRPYIVYGPGESAGIAAGPSIALRAAATHEAAQIRFSGRVGFVHVLNVARAMVEALSAPPCGAQVFDLCGQTASMENFRELLCKQAPHADISIQGEPLKLPENLMGGGSAAWFDDLPVTTLEDGIAQTLQHWQTHSKHMDSVENAADMAQTS